MKCTKKHLLLITYFYPPIQAAPSYRTVSFVKYLPRFGYQVTVLTVTINKFTWNGPLSEPFISRDNVLRTRCFNIGEFLKALFPGRFSGYGKTRTEFKSKHASAIKKSLVYLYDNLLTFPDPAWLWYPLGMNKAIRIAKQIKPDIILSSAMPISAHLLALHIKSRLHIPWIADYRDLWSQSHINYRKPIFNRLERSIENKIIKEADALTTVSEPLAIKLRQQYKKLVHVITNGYDPDDFDVLLNKKPSDWNYTQINAVYTGMIYPERQDPKPLFKAIQLLIETNRIKQGDFKFRLFGPNLGFVKSLFPSNLLEEFVVIGDNLPRDHALNYQKKADLLIVFDWTDTEEKGVYTTKFFEYIGAEKPILSIGPKGTVIDCALRKDKLGISENDPNLVADILEDFIKSKHLKGYNRSKQKVNQTLEKYTRNYQARNLANIMDYILDKNRCV